MTVAFQTAPLNSPKPPTMTTAREEYRPSEFPAPSASLRRPKPLYGSYEDLEPKERGHQEDDVDEHYSRSEMKARAGQFAQAFAGAFNFSVDPGVTLKAGSILAPIQAQVEHGIKVPAKKTRARKSK